MVNACGVTFDIVGVVTVCFVACKVGCVAMVLVGS